VAELAGKVILLTGGADGIGRECALAYAREGAVVAILDRDLDKRRSLPPRRATTA
jgi:meso-butanediol dehydrogenase/(S,S)-butanediol dehydrogenase/diacetyl reductase